MPCYSLNLSLENIPQLVNNIIKEINLTGLSSDTAFDIKLALEEALVNAVKHGNKQDDTKKVFIKAEVIGNDRLEIEVKDQGKGFDYLNLFSPISEEKLESFSGRGIFLIQKHMDEVIFFDGGRGIKMIKCLK